MPTRDINCQGQITDTGQVQLLDKGFCYSLTENYPTLISPNTYVWSVPGALGQNNSYQGTLTGLTQATYYYINAYATNTIGTAYSFKSDYVKTLGINVYPTVSIGVKNVNTGLPQTVFEMGAFNSLIVSGVTVQNDETLFINGYINQNGTTILSWNGYKATYSNTDPPNSGYSPNTPLTVSFVANANIPSTWSVLHEVFYNCGNPQYQITNSISSDAVFPIGWVLKSSAQNQTYFNPVSLLSPYFYSDISITPPVNNNKLIEKKGNKTFMVTPSAFLPWLIIGAPSEYGTIQFSLDNSTWANAPYQTQWTVSSGAVLYPQPAWTHTYTISQYKFTKSFGIPTPFYIRFV